jgi:hypothetical protein
MMALRSVAASLLPFICFLACVTQAQAQDNGPGTQGRLVKNIQATVVDVPITGPFDARMDTAVASRPIEVGPDDAEEDAEAEATPKAFQQAGMALAGRSAVAAAAASKLTLPTPQSFDFGESIFFLPSQRSQEATTRWKATQNAGQDPQVAAGHSLVAVLTWDTLTFYDKSGNPLPSINDPAHPGRNFANPTSTEAIFARVVKQLDANLKLNAKAQHDPSFLFEAGEIGDARVIFDNFRNRWVVLATAKNNHPTTKDFALLTSQRRTKLLLAVSRDEDPRDGFRTFGLDATPDDGACGKNSDDSPCPGSRFTPGNAADYPSIGVSKTHYILTIGVGHAPLDGSAHTPLFTWMVVLNAHDVADGVSASSIRKRAFAGWDLGEGDRTVGVSMPAVMNNDLPGLLAAGWGLVANTASDHIILTGVSPADPPALLTMNWDMPDIEGAPDWPQKGSKQLVQYGNLGNQPVNATVQGTTLATGFVDCRTWTDSQNTCSPSLHLVTFDLTSFPFSMIRKDRVLGLRSFLDDAKNDVVAYGLPGIAANKDGDIAVVYGRSSPKMFMEARFSTWLHNELDVRPSRELHQGEVALGVGCIVPCKPDHPDTAGVSVDPFDSRAIWIGQSFADLGPSVMVEVGKVFGEQHPDLWMWSANVTTAKTGLKAGDPVGVLFEMLNGGDGAAENARAELLLVASDGKKTSLGETTAAKLGAGDSISTNLVGKIPASLAKGSYKVEVLAKLKAGEKQYSEDNDSVTAGNVQVK